MTDRPSVSISQIQKSTTAKRRTSLAKEAQDFKERNAEATWQENSEVKNCCLCKTKFSLTKRRHHCRDCGGIFCGKCSSFKTVIEGELKRSCFSCYKKAVGKDSSKSSVVIDTGTGKQQQQQRPSILTSSAPAPSESEEAAPRPSDASGEGSDLPNWAEAILFIRKAGGDGPTLKASFPEDCLTDEMIQDIYLNAMPKPLRGNKKQEIKYFFRVRDKQLVGAPEVRDENEETVGTLVTKTTVFYNCYVFYRQQVVYDNEAAAGSNTNGTLMRQSIILVSKWPFPRLAFRMLEKLDEACFWSAETTKAAPPIQSGGGGSARSRTQSSSGSFSPTKNAAAENNSCTGWDLSPATINNVLMVGFGQLGVWPTATPSSLIYLHFFGELLQYNVAANIWSTYGANLSFSSILPSINLVALFAPLGLLQHLWILWELLVAGQDIVVVASSPTQCSEVVLALSSLLLPLVRVTDLRPYIHEDDSDIPLIGATAEMKYQRMFEGSEQSVNINDKSMIVGVTDLAVLNYFECFGALLLLPPAKKVEPGATKEKPVDLAFTGMRTKNAAIFHQITGQGNAPKKASRNIFKKRSSVTTSKGSSGGGNTGSFVDYCSNWLDSGSSQVALVTRHEASSITMKKLLVKIKNMNPAVRNVLGDKLLRDNLQEMTLSYFKPSVGSGGSDGISNVEASNMKENMIERAELAEARAHQSGDDGKGTAGAIITPNELWTWFIALPMWVLGNVPTVLMWVAYFSAYLVGYLVGIPPVLLLAGGFLVKVPEKASPQFEALLGVVLPAWILFPDIGKTTATGSSGSESSGSSSEDGKNSYAAKDEAVAPVRVDFSGVWKRVKLDNYDGLLAAQGAGFMQRKLAASIPMTHTITMDEGCSVFRLQEKGGPIDTDNTYVVDGPEMATTTLKNSYLDKMTRYGKTIRIRKVIMPGQEYELMMERELLDNGKTLKVKGTFTDLKGKNPTVVGSTYFELVGPSPNARPAGVPGASAAVAASSTSADSKGVASPATPPVAAGSKKTDLSGVWQRTKTANFEAFVGASGGGFMQRKLAASMALTHTITMDTPKLEAFALHEKGGPIDTNQTLTIGASFQPFLVNGKKFKQRAYWQKEALVFIRRADDDSFDLIMSRTIDSTGDQMVLKSIHKDLLTGKQTEATSWFAKTGKSTNPVPKADLSLVVKGSENEASGSGADGGGAAEAEVEDVDNDEDDDDQALAKMRSVSTAAVRSNLTSLTGAITQVSKNTDFGGVWIQNNATHFDAAQVDVNMSLTHTIVMQKREVRVKESICGRVIDDSTFSVDAEEVAVEYVGKPCRVRVFFEGKTLALHRVIDDDQVEYFVRRDLEDDGKVLRLVTLQRNLYTGEESESMTLFNNAKWLN